MVWDLLPSWVLSMRAERKADKTIKSYTEGVDRFLKWCERTGTPPELTATTVQAFIADLLDHGAEASTALSRQKALRQFAAWLVTEGELDVNPLLGLKPPKQDKKVTHALTDDQLKALLKACQGRTLRDRRDEAAVRLMVETGLRAAETVGLQMSDVDLTRGLALVHRGKGGKGRFVPFGPQTAAALDRYIRARKAHNLADTTALWVGYRSDRPLTYMGLDKTLRQRARDAGIEKFHLHLLRHTAAHRWLRAGGSEQGLMAVAGWSNRSMLDRYTSSSASERAADEARKLGLGDL
ncbi:tyrosine-type recombinase/integrase [Mycolicibacterium sp. BiH015]|uniref:tyrosine-type recombinase/integrase n=1 Tax=Mycolicibacterium sp. BiH015 TaxID=3018808 RepID=UPI0022E0B524|nr:tyrosine-type recombinase/integrase [Mycolicibacterium sp. BiH015]MDA2893067.1 tyrosine-type recombinase/integrase [Mycolicibacterium sp. BiH015]